MRNRSDKTQALHDSFAARYVAYFGELPLSKLSRFQVEAWRDWLMEQPINHGGRWKRDKKLSPKTVTEMLHWLKGICRYYDINPNPVDRVELPRKSKEQALDETVTFYTDDEMNKILEASKGTVFELPLLILLNTGCRPAELHYLHNTPKEIDRENKIVRFIDKLQRPRGIQLTEKPFSEAWDAIIKWIEVNKIEEGELLFPSDPNWMRKRWHTVLRRAKMPECRVHQLRHQFVKKCFFDYGYDLTWISKWCGHSTDTAFRVYSNIMVQAPKNGGNGMEIVSPVVGHKQVPTYSEDRKLKLFIEGKVKGQETVTISKEDFEWLVSQVPNLQGTVNAYKQMAAGKVMVPDGD